MKVHGFCKKIAAVIALVVISMVHNSCITVVENTNIPYAYVRFVIDVSLSGADYELLSYCEPKVFTTTSPAVNSYGTGYYGYSGVVVVRDIIDTETVSLSAFDICCPYECDRDIVVEADGYYMTCPNCGSSFSVCNGSGYPVEGECLTSQPLKQYKVVKSSSSYYLILNDD